MSLATVPNKKRCERIKCIWSENKIYMGLLLRILIEMCVCVCMVFCRILLRRSSVYILSSPTNCGFHLKMWPVTQASHYLTQAISVVLQQDRLVSYKEEMNYRVTHKIGHLSILVAVKWLLAQSMKTSNWSGPSIR